MSGIATCPPKTDLEKVAEMPDGLDKTMNAMGVESCKTDTSKDEYNYAMGGKMEVNIPLAGASVEVHSTGGGMTTASSSVGCEQITAIAKSSVDVTDKIKCTIKSSVLDSSQTAKAYNRVEFKVKNLNLMCDDGFNIDQRNKVTLKSSISFSADQMKDVESTIKDGLKQTSEIIKNTETGWGATPEGKKYIEQTQEKIVKGEYDASITENVMRIAQYAEGENVLKFEGDVMTLRGKQCQISQENVLDLVSEMVYNDSIRDVFKEYYEKTREYDLKMDETTVSGGVSTLPPATIPPLTGSSGSTTTNIIFAVLVIIVIAAGGFFWWSQNGAESE